jgi:CRISPR-associated protein Cas2
MVSQLYWVIYDITGNALRGKVAARCKNYGLRRVQKSAFLGPLTRNRAEMLAIELRDLVTGTGEQCIFIIPSCKSCFGAKDIIGHFDEEAVTEKDFIVITGRVAEGEAA